MIIHSNKRIVFKTNKQNKTSDVWLDLYGLVLTKLKHDVK